MIQIWIGVWVCNAIVFFQRDLSLSEANPEWKTVSLSSPRLLLIKSAFWSDDILDDCFRQIFPDHLCGRRENMLDIEECDFQRGDHCQECTCGSAPAVIELRSARSRTAHAQTVGILFQDIPEHSIGRFLYLRTCHPGNGIMME